MKVLKLALKVSTLELKILSLRNDSHSNGQLPVSLRGASCYPLLCLNVCFGVKRDMFRKVDGEGEL